MNISKDSRSTRLGAGKAEGRCRGAAGRNDDTRRQFLNLASGVRALFQSLLPDASALQFGPTCKVFQVLADKIRSELPEVDISAVMNEIESLLNRSIEADGYVMPPVSKIRRDSLT